MINKYDAIIIGFGKGGKTLGADLGSKGLKVALIEKSKQMYGGTCINVACIPTKSLENQASKIRRHNLNDFYEMKLKYEQAIENKDALTKKLRMANYNKLDKNENITIFTGEASFVNENTVEVNTLNDEKIILEGEKIFINTGSKSFIPSIKGIENTQIVYTSKTLMNLKQLPKKMTIIGAGFIGLEFAGIYSSFGSEVTIINTHDTILPKEDEDDVAEIVSILEKRRVKILNKVSIKEIIEENDVAKIQYTDGNEEKELISDIILVATGRKANIENLKLENAGVKLNDRGFIKVDNTLQTTTKNIWAIGDVNGGPQFTYISLDDYRIIVNHLFGDKTRKVSDRKNIPSALFLDPPFARVGLNIKQAKEKGHKILVAKMKTENIPRAKQIGKTEGFIKIVIDKDTEEILGATIICDESSEMIHLLQLAIDMKVKYTYLRDRIYAHPTMTEGLNDVLSSAMIKEI